MRLLFFIIMAWIAAVDPATVKKINAAKSAAEDAFKRGDYTAAIGHYRYLVDSLGVAEDEVVLNLANACFLAKDTANALSAYQQVSASSDSRIRSKANQQLGIMAHQQQKFEEALGYFKEAIRAEPSNDDARYNYEMLKKKLEEQKKKEEQQKQQQNKDQQQKDQEQKDQEQKDQEQKDQQQKDQQQKEEDQKNKDEQSKDQQEKEQQEKDKQQKEQEEKEKQKQEEQQQKDAQEKEMPNLDREKLEQMKISEEKARMILEAMKNQEKQYLQQQRRKPTQSRDRNEPDW